MQRQWKPHWKRWTVPRSRTLAKPTKQLCRYLKRLVTYSNSWTFVCAGNAICLISARTICLIKRSRMFSFRLRQKWVEYDKLYTKQQWSQFISHSMKNKRSEEMTKIWFFRTSSYFVYRLNAAGRVWVNSALRCYIRACTMSMLFIEVTPMQRAVRVRRHLLKQIFFVLFLSSFSFISDVKTGFNTRARSCMLLRRSTCWLHNSSM